MTAAVGTIAIINLVVFATVFFYATTHDNYPGWIDAIGMACVACLIFVELPLIVIYGMAQT